MHANLQTLEQQRAEFSSRRFLAMPLSGTICWLIAGVINIFVSAQWAALVLFIATGSIIYVAMLVARFTGEDMFKKSKTKNFCCQNLSNISNTLARARLHEISRFRLKSI